MPHSEERLEDGRVVFRGGFAGGGAVSCGFRQADIINWLAASVVWARQRRPLKIILGEIERIEGKDFADEISRLISEAERRVSHYRL
jgi:hypothetical protein